MLEPMLDVKEILKLFPISERTWYRLVKKGIAPRSVPISERRVAWRQSDILKYQEAQAAKAGLN
jgi:predicted DNA-binding transcriptional regulator AlpA